MLNEIDCTGLLTWYWGDNKEESDQAEVLKKIIIESEKWRIIENLEGFNYSGHFAKKIFPLCKYLESSINQMKREDIESGTAIDLGCGNSETTTHLLKMGWKVFAVDPSKEMLLNLLQRANGLNSEWRNNNQLSVVCQKMEEYELPENIQLVIANNSLLHCDPKKIRSLFQRIFNCLSKCGRFIGNFNLAPKENDQEYIFRLVFKAWFADKPTVEYLLDDAGFQTEVCAYNSYWFEPTLVEFVGRKA
jgi:SAM-dependent methyltransferase